MSLSSSMSVRVSVVIPCFNGEEYLAEAVDSVLAQTYEQREVIVVDDGSSDRSIDILNRYQDQIHVLRHATNRGNVAARNTGVHTAIGEYIAFLDSDDYWDPQFLSKLVAAIDRSGAGIAYCGWQNVGLPEPRGSPFVPPDYENADKLRTLLRSCPWPIHGALIRRDIVASVGAFDETLTSCADFDLWLRTAPFCRLVRVPEVLAYYRFHGGVQITKNRLRIIMNHWRVQQKFLAANPDLAHRLGRQVVRDSTLGLLLERGNEQYWASNLEPARSIFREVMRHGYGSPRDWCRMMPALLPMSLHRALRRLF